MLFIPLFFFFFFFLFEYTIWTLCLEEERDWPIKEEWRRLSILSLSLSLSPSFRQVLLLTQQYDSCVSNIRSNLVTNWCWLKFSFLYSTVKYNFAIKAKTSQVAEALNCHLEFFTGSELLFMYVSTTTTTYMTRQGQQYYVYIFGLYTRTTSSTVSGTIVYLSRVCLLCGQSSTQPPGWTRAGRGRARARRCRHRRNWPAVGCCRFRKKDFPLCPGNVKYKMTVVLVVVVVVKVRAKVTFTLWCSYCSS